MQAKAVLVLYQPGCKFKNNKYLLSLGSNIVGSDPKCQVMINSKNYFPQQYVANFYVTEDFMYIQALCDDMVQLKSNMQIQISGRKKQIFKYIQKSCRYVLPMEQIFYIGPYKAIVQVQIEQQLKRIKNILNIQYFQTPIGDEAEQQKIQRKKPTSQRIQLQVDYNFDRKSDKTEKIQSQNGDEGFQATLIIQQNDPFVYEPTLAIDEGYVSQQKSNNNNVLNRSPRYQPNPQIQNQYSQTITKQINKKSQFSDISMFSRQRQKRKNVFSQQILYQTIKKQQNQFKKQISKQQNNENGQDEMSMPDTIQQNIEQILKTQILQNQQQQMPLTIQQDEMPPTINDDQMPATIKDDEQIPQYNMVKTVKSLFERGNLTSANQQKKDLSKSQKLYKDISKKQQQQEDFQDIDDVFNLFGKNNVKKIESNQIEMEQKKEVKKEVNKKPFINFQINNYRNQNVLPHVCMDGYQQKPSLFSSLNSNNQKLQKSSNLNNSTEKKYSPNGQNHSNQTSENTNQNLVRKRLFKISEKPTKFANLSGFKPKPEDILTLRKRGYQIVPQARIEDYDILIIGKNYVATPKLLKAIVLDKRIVSQDWVKDKQWDQNKKYKLQGTIQGISWQIIQQQRGKRDVFNGAGMFYLTQTLNDYRSVFEYTGGSITQELNKRKKTNLIIDCQAVKDKEFYEQNKASKNWKFYSHKLIGESILIGQPQFKKYIVDDTCF